MDYNHLRVPFGLVLNDDHLINFTDIIQPKKSRKFKHKKNKTLKN